MFPCFIHSSTKLNSHRLHHIPVESGWDPKHTKKNGPSFSILCIVICCGWTADFCFRNFRTQNSSWRDREVQNQNICSGLWEFWTWHDLMWDTMQVCPSGESTWLGCLSTGGSPPPNSSRVDLCHRIGNKEHVCVVLIVCSHICTL